MTDGLKTRRRNHDHPVYSICDDEPDSAALRARKQRDEFCHDGEDKGRRKRSDTGEDEQHDGGQEDGTRKPRTSEELSGNSTHWT